MNTYLTITDKASYLAWRTQWRAEYAALSTLIRKMKWARWFLASTSKKSEAQEARYKALAAKRARKYGFHPAGQCCELAATATNMLEIRKLSKARAQEQYLMQKQITSASSASSASTPSPQPASPCAAQET